MILKTSGETITNIPRKNKKNETTMFLISFFSLNKKARGKINKIPNSPIGEELKPAIKKIM